MVTIFFENMFEKIISGEELTTKNLNECGFSSKDLTNLVKDGILERVKRGLYVLKKIEIDDKCNFYKYAKKLIKNQDYEKAMICFEKCYLIDSNHFGANFQMFKRNIEIGKFEQCYVYLDKIYENENYKSDCYLYILLLNFITELPQKYQDIAKNVLLEDLLISKSDLRYKGYENKINEIRTEIFNGKFSIAAQNYFDYINEVKVHKLVDIVTRRLLNYAIKQNNIVKYDITILINQKDYEKIQNYILKNSENRQLTVLETSILKIVEAILEIKNCEEIPTPEITNTINMDEALLYHDYEKAIELYESYCDKYNINKKRDIKYILLNDLEKLLIDKKNEKVNYLEIVDYILNYDIKTLVKKLRIFLREINKEEYEFLIIDHIKLSLLQNDNISKTLSILACLGSDNYKFNILEYINQFYLALTDGYIEDAELYLDIIKQSKNIGGKCIYIKDLEEIFENTKEVVLKYREENKVENIEPEQKVKDKIILEREDLLNPEPIKVVKKKVETYDIQHIKEAISKKREILIEQGGVILLPTMEETERKEYIKEISKYKDLNGFVIGEGRNARIVIRYKPFLQNFDANETIRLIKEAEKDYNLKKAIELQLIMLQFGTPKAKVYAKLGQLYERSKKDDKAIMYYTIAMELSKTEEVLIDYTQRIKYLKGNIEKNEIKPTPKFDELSFSDDIENYYGINNFEEINEQILLSGLDIESYCINNGISEEETDLLKLIYAKLYYYKGLYEMGDKFLNSVVTKDEKIKRIKKEISINKHYYINRVHEKDLSFVRKLKP